MFSQQQYKIIKKNILKIISLKRFVLLLILAYLPACQKYLVGDIHAKSLYSGDIMFMNYTNYYGKTFISGKTPDNKAFSGEVLSPKKIDNMGLTNVIRYPSHVRDKNKYYFARLNAQGNGVLFDCFIKLTDLQKFNRGGAGTCYSTYGDIYDITIYGKGYTGLKLF